MPAHNRFLEGSFAPVPEEITAVDLPVTSRLPAELSGRYLRNGPNPLGLDDPNYGCGKKRVTSTKRARAGLQTASRR